LRLYLMFMGPLDSSRVWDSKAIMGNFRFLKRVWNFVTDRRESGIRDVVPQADESGEVKRAIHLAIKRVSEDIEGLRFNTGIAALMECINTLIDHPVSKETLETFVLLLSPFAPHLAEELWERLGHSESLAY